MLASENAQAGHTRWEVAAGVAFPYNTDDFLNDHFPGPQVTLGVRRRLVGKFESGLLVDGQYARHNWDGIPAYRGEGGNRKLVQGTILLGTHFEETPNISLGIGYFRLWQSEIRGINFDLEPYRYHFAPKDGAVLQVEVRLDVARLHTGDFFISGRYVHQIDGVEYDRLTAFPLTAGFRFR